jgi:hypothetical protein
MCNQGTVATSAVTVRPHYASRCGPNSSRPAGRQPAPNVGKPRHVGTNGPACLGSHRLSWHARAPSTLPPLQTQVRTSLRCLVSVRKDTFVSLLRVNSYVHTASYLQPCRHRYDSPLSSPGEVLNLAKFIPSEGVKLLLLRLLLLLLRTTDESSRVLTSRALLTRASV